MKECFVCKKSKEDSEFSDYRSIENGQKILCKDCDDHFKYMMYIE
jgi:hypothetical protein